MTDLAAALTVTSGDAAQMRQLRDELLDVYNDDNRERINDPFYSPTRYWQRLESYSSSPGFSLMTGRLHGALIGYALGYRLPASTRWWAGLTTTVDESSIAEDGERTFALNELRLRPGLRGSGYGRALHDALLAGRPEQRATLLVRQDNSQARDAYLAWGWQKLGEVQPFADSPVFDAMVLGLKRGVSSSTRA